jgi:transcriptional regulator with XRE-family HTH domain
MIPSYHTHIDTWVSSSLSTPAQLRAARHLVSLQQADIAAATGLSLPTIKRAESDRDVQVSDEAIAAIRLALETAGVEFTNDRGRPGVRLKMSGDTHSDLQQQISHMQARVDFDEPTGGASPKRGMQQLRRAKSKNELMKLKNRRARLERRVKK